MDECQGHEGEMVSWVTPVFGACTRWMDLPQNLSAEHGKNAPNLLDLHILTLEHSCVATVIQKVDMLAGSRAGGMPEDHCELPGC